MKIPDINSTPREWERFNRRRALTVRVKALATLAGVVSAVAYMAFVWWGVRS